MSEQRRWLSAEEPTRRRLGLVVVESAAGDVEALAILPTHRIPQP